MLGMAVYKVPQDIEADDKLIGWMSFKQFIFAIVAVVSIFLIFLTLSKGIWPLSIILLPFAIIPGVLAAPLGRDQPTEIWLAARLRFFLKPRKRIWNQSGIKELVTITVPKKEEVYYSDGLSQTEVKSRLEALANTLDSRGWAVKNVTVNLFAQPSYAYQTQGDDRLVSMEEFPQEVPTYDVFAADDIMDTDNNPTAQRLNQQVQATSQRIHDQAVAGMFGKVPAPGPVYTNQTPPIAAAPSITTQDEAALVEHAHDEQKRRTMQNMHVLQPHQATQNPTPVAQPIAQPHSTAPPDQIPAIINLAQNNDFSVATIAKQANQAIKAFDDDQEVVVSLR